MEQMYLFEILVDKVTVFASDEDANSGANKSLIIKIKFGPTTQFIVKEGQLAKEDRKDDIIETDEKGRRKWTRTIRVGKSYLFPSYPDTLLVMLEKFPLDIEVWNDDENEEPIFVGVGDMLWDKEFYRMLKEADDPRKLHDPLTIKQTIMIWAECCCKPAGEIAFIVRLSPLGSSISTEFQQLMKDPDSFVFRTNRAPSTFQCKRIEGDDPNFCMVGSLYETTTLEDPDVVNKAQDKIEICTELQSCGAKQGGDPSCQHGGNEPLPKQYPIDKIRMGDITGPCGNTNCQLAHKVKNYIRSLDKYKSESTGKVSGNKTNTTKKVCGACSCKDDRYHRDECPTMQGVMKKTKCKGCGGMTKTGDTCEDRKRKMYCTGATPPESKPATPSGSKTTSKTTVGYVLSVPAFNESMFGKNYIVENMTAYYQSEKNNASSSLPAQGCCCRKSAPSTVDLPPAHASSTKELKPADNKQSSKDQQLHRVNMTESNRVQIIYSCSKVPDAKDCKCSPLKPTPPCRTFDCDCLTEIENTASRKAHKSYCPLYKHKNNCPVTTMKQVEEDGKKVEDDEDETVPLPYGLPPIQLGPCPVLGRPCTVPDGFARMYKTATNPPLPPSYSDAGKVCCSKEYNRIKQAIKQYMKNDKDNDFRCINKFDVDTEKRCCDKEQRLRSLMGKGCCGSHKLAILEKYKDK